MCLTPNRMFCFTCKLFSNVGNVLPSQDYSIWRPLNKRLKFNEASLIHQQFSVLLSTQRNKFNYRKQLIALMKKQHNLKVKKQRRGQLQRFTVGDSGTTVDQNKYSNGLQLIS